MAVSDREIRVLIVDDDQVLAEALSLAMERERDLTIVGTARNVREGLDRAARTRPDVILMDFHLPDGTGAEAARSLAETGPGVAVVVLTIDDADETLLATIESGAAGFLRKRDGLAEVAEAVRRAAGGEILFPPERMVRLVGRLQRRERRASERDSLRDRLTAREQEILRLMGEGLDTKAMAARLVLSTTTIRTHVQSILGKLEAHSRLEAVARATQAGLLGA
jgi:DNA-binding NarL/FixJ family response regulator